VKTHTIGTDTFAIFEKQNKGNLLMLHFLWGKKDFRAFLEREGTSVVKVPPHHFTSAKDGEYVLTRVQYLYDYDWYDYDGLGGHGLAHDEVRWKLEKRVRYLELPQHFLECVSELLCREMELEHKPTLSRAG